MASQISYTLSTSEPIPLYPGGHTGTLQTAEVNILNPRSSPARQITDKRLQRILSSVSLINFTTANRNRSQLSYDQSTLRICRPVCWCLLSASWDAKPQLVKQENSQRIKIENSWKWKQRDAGETNKNLWRESLDDQKTLLKVAKRGTANFVRTNGRQKPPAGLKISWNYQNAKGDTTRCVVITDRPAKKLWIKIKRSTRRNYKAKMSWNYYSTRDPLRQIIIPERIFAILVSATHYRMTKTS